MFSRTDDRTDERILPGFDKLTTNSQITFMYNGTVPGPCTARVFDFDENWNPVVVVSKGICCTVSENEIMMIDRRPNGTSHFFAVTGIPDSHQKHYLHLDARTMDKAIQEAKYREPGFAHGHRYQKIEQFIDGKLILSRDRDENIVDHTTILDI